MNVYVLGGGPAGLAVADGLSGCGNTHFTVIEREAILGGLARTVTWGDHGRHDLGPHKIFTTNVELMARIKALLPEEEWLVRPKKGSIYMRGHYLPYPPSPFSLVNVYGIKEFAGMVLSYTAARLVSLTGKDKPETFEEDLLLRLGRGVYEALFKPIALKLWGDPAKLDIKLSRNRVQTPALMEVLMRLLKLSAKSSFEALNFLYPKGGLQRLWDAIEEKTRFQGDYLLKSEVTGLECNGAMVSKIMYRNLESGVTNTILITEDDVVISTLPLKSLCGLMGNAIHHDVIKLINENVNLNTLILVFLKINKSSLLDESWVFVPDPDIVFHRLSEQESFDPDMTEAGSIVCCEIMDNSMRPMHGMTDGELITRAEEGLKKMNYTFQTKDSKVIRLSSSYPVYEKGFEPALDAIIESFDSFGNFRTIGRQGSYNYIGTLDAMDIGYGMVRWLISNTKGVNSWQTERNRTRHYPVLD